MKKKIIILFLSLFLMNYKVFAMGEISIDYQLENDKYVLVIYEDDHIISYDDAIAIYNLEVYKNINIDGNYHYFYKGNEISKEEYNVEVEELNVKNNCKELNLNCVRVKTTEEIIQSIDEIYASKEINMYYLVYTPSEYKNIDFDKVTNYFKDKYIGDVKKNMYKYGEYYWMTPEKILPYYDENWLVINTQTIKTTEEEIAKVDKFLEEFLKYFDGKSDYEKVLGAYTYINNTANYEKDDGYTRFIDGQLSAYDVLFKHKAVCIGASTTFQLLMERLGIESYIVDHVYNSNDDKYITTHTYNTVKLDNEWYIVDIAFDDNLSGLLKGMSKNYSLEDFKYYDIKIADNSYFDTHANVNRNFEFDYASLLNLSNKIDKQEKQDSQEEQGKKNNYNVEYILIVIILLIIMIIIWFFTRK